MPGRICRVCEEEKPLSDFHIRTDSGKPRGECKACSYRLGREIIQGIRQRKPRWDAGEGDTRRCRLCGESKPVEEFYQRADTGKPRSECTQCLSKRAAEGYDRNRDRRIQQANAWIASNRERHHEYQRRWQERRKLNPEAVLADVEQRRRRYPRLWERYRLVMYERNNRRRARKFGVEVERVSFARIVQRDGDRCHISGGTVTETDREFDQFIPLAAGGPHTDANIRIAHRRCNRQ